MNMDVEVWKCFYALKELLPIYCLYSRKAAESSTRMSVLCDPTQFWDQILTVNY